MTEETLTPTQVQDAAIVRRLNVVSNLLREARDALREAGRYLYEEVPYNYPSIADTRSVLSMMRDIGNLDGPILTIDNSLTEYRREARERSELPLLHPETCSGPADYALVRKIHRA